MIMTNRGFTHLHVHTEYSIQDGLSKIPALVKRVKELGMNACAITDHGVGYGLPEFYNICKKEGIKPILGCEVYIAPGSRFDKTKDNGEKAYSHLILLVKNEVGYKNLCILISRSNTEGFYYKPRIDFELLKDHHEGLVCLSACIAGEVPRAIIGGQKDKAERIALKYKELFGEDYYLEIQNHGIKEEQIVANELIGLSRKHHIKLVCTNDSHYINSEDAEAHEWLLCLQSGKKLQDPDRLIYHGDYSLKSEEDMRALFPSLPDAFDNTMEITDKCTCALDAKDSIRIMDTVNVFPRIFILCLCLTSSRHFPPWHSSSEPGSAHFVLPNSVFCQTFPMGLGLKTLPAMSEELRD